LRVAALGLVLFGVSTAEAATVRIFNTVSAAEPENICRVWAKLVGDVADPVHVGVMGPGQYLEWDDPVGPGLTGTLVCYYTFDSTIGAGDWWLNQGYSQMQAGNWVTASLGGQVTPYVYIAPSNRVLQWYGTLRLWNRTAIEQTVVMNPNVTLTIPAGENVEWSRLMASTPVITSPFWSLYQTVVPSEANTNNQMWMFWVFIQGNSYTQMHIQNGQAGWQYCLSHAVPQDDAGVDMAPIEWGPCADAGVLPPEPGAGGGGGGGGGGEGNGTNGGGGAGGGGDGNGTTIIIDLTELVNLATTRNNLMGLAIACCEEGHVIARNASFTNSFHLIENNLRLVDIINLLTPPEHNGTDEEAIAEEIGEAIEGVDDDVGGIFALPALGGIFDLGDNPIDEPPAGAFLIPWQVGQGQEAQNMDISLDYREIENAQTISGWVKNIMTMILVGIWIWAVYKHCEKLSHELWTTPQTKTSGETVLGTNLNLATAAANGVVILGIIATFWIFAIGALSLVPCMNEITGSFGDVSAPGGEGGNAVQVVTWTMSEFFPIMCALSLLGSYAFFRVTAMVQLQAMKGVVKLAIA